MKPERFPDLLRERVGTYFERDGLCFAPVLETSRDGACVMAVYFQNRYRGKVDARVRVLPPRRMMGLMRRDLPAPTFEIDCPGAAFGVARAPFPIRDKHQGRTMVFDVQADVRYPAGREELLRYRPGSSSTRVRLLLLQGVVGMLAPSKPVSECESIWVPTELDAQISPLRVAA